MVETKREHLKEQLASTRGSPAPKPDATTAEAGARQEQLNRSPDADQRAAPAAPTGPSAAGRKAETEEWTKQAEAAKKQSDADLKQAYDKAGKVNMNLANDGLGVRMEPEVREGEVRYKWGNFVPTRILTDEEVKALESMGKAEKG
jgi:hypothetical protein